MTGAAASPPHPAADGNDGSRRGSSATGDLKQDHVFIRRLQVVIERCYSLLYQGRDVPLEDIARIADIIEQFVDRFHHHKEESGYFPETEHKDHFEQEIHKFLVEHEFGRRIAKRIRIHLQEWQEGKEKEAREPLARFLRTYSIFILDHTSKEDRFFTEVEERRSLSAEEEKGLAARFEQIKSTWRQRNDDLFAALEQLERAEWMVAGGGGGAATEAAAEKKGGNDRYDDDRKTS